MKTTFCLLACLAATALSPAQSPQPPTAPRPATPPPPGESFSDRLQQVIQRASPAAPEPVLTKFSLDFPGGTPKQLVAAIEKAMGKPLNAIISEEHADTKIPPLRMNHVDVRQLFSALESVSLNSEAYFGFGNSYQIAQTFSTFKTQGPASDDSIWIFKVEKPIQPPKLAKPDACRYFSLAPYLDRGQTVEDITTAIQTGWKMLGEDETPKISFHQETRLLIAVGEPGKLETIDDVLKALNPAPQPTFIDPTTGLPVPAAMPQLPQRTLKTAPASPKPPSGNAPQPAKP